MVCIIIVSFLLNGNISQVSHHIVELTHLVAVFFIAEPCESKGTQPYFQWLITCHKNINSEIKFLASNKERLVNISTNNIGLLLDLRLEWELTCVGPFLNLFKFIYKENALTLGSIRRLHDPGCVWVLFKLLDENGVITWENICHGNDVHITQVAVVISIGNGIVFLLHVLSEPFYVLYHQVLPGQLEMVWIMVQYSTSTKKCY